MQVNPHMQGMMPMAPVSSTMQPAMPQMMAPGMQAPGQLPMMAYGQQPQQQFVGYHPGAAPMPAPVMPPPQMPPPQMQMQANPMNMQFMMQQQPQQQQLLLHQQPLLQRSQQHGGGGSGGGHNPMGRVFIGNLNTNELGRADVERIFSRHGHVAEVNVHNGFAFVQYIDEPTARAACQREDGKVYAGQTIDVNIASEPKNRRDRHGGGSSLSGSGVAASGVSVKDRLGPRRLPSVGHEDNKLFDSGSSGKLSAGSGRLVGDRLPASRDFLVCGYCRDLFSSADRLIEHKREGCRRRFVCRCKLSGEPRTLDCAKCGRQFLSSWELLRHCQAEHEISVFANCIFAPSAGGGGNDSASAATAAASAAASGAGGDASSVTESAAGGGGDGENVGDTSTESATGNSEDVGVAGGGSSRRRRGETDDYEEEEEDDDDEERSGSEKSN